MGPAAGFAGEAGLGRTPAAPAAPAEVALIVPMRLGSKATAPSLLPWSVVSTIVSLEPPVSIKTVSA
jgi:hypothetical protein